MVKITELLCPEGHVILMTAYEEDAGKHIEACDAIEAMVGPTGPLKRQCMLCGSRDLHFEEKTTPWKTLIEAAPHLGAQHAADMEERRKLDAAGKTIQRL